MCEWALERLDQLVLKPVDGSGGKGLVIGPAASETTLADLRAKVLADPRGWIAQEPVALSTAPTYVDGRMGAAPPRPAPVRGERRARRVGRARRAHPGRAPGEGSLVVNSSQGGGSKDTWVLAAADRRARGPDRRRAAPSPPPPMPSAAPDPRPAAGAGHPAATAAMSGIARPAVLSRIAESLYWIGRYTERAEDTARLLDVHYHLLLEDRRADEAAVCGAPPRRDGRRRAAIGGEPERGDGHRAARARPHVLRLDHVLGGRGVGERARRARGDLVGDVGDAQHDAPRARRAGPVPAPAAPGTTSSAGCATARAACRPRRRDDEPRRRLAVLLVLGRSLERVDMTARLLSRPLRRRLGPHRVDDDAALLLGLRGVPAHVPARGRRRDRGRVPAARPAVPALGVPRADDRREQPRRARPAPARAGVDDEARRRLGRVRAELEFLRVDEAMDDLPEAAGATAARVRRRARGHRPAVLPRDPRDRVERLTDVAGA